MIERYLLSDVNFDEKGSHATVRSVLKPEQFSLNHFKMDDSYPKRLWRLSKNLALRNNNKYWSICYEIRYSLIDYLGNKFTTQNEGQLEQQYVQEQGSPVSKEQFIKRFVNNMREFCKIKEAQIT